MMGEEGNRTGMLITSVNGVPVSEHSFARFLLDAGFQSAPMGFNLRRILLTPPGQTEDVAHA
jgi:ATP-dependent Lhr-like helicase